MYKMLAGLLLCLTSCNADPLKTFEVYVREDFILSEKPVAEFYGEVYGSISNSHFSIAYSTDEQSLKSDDYRQREEVHRLDRLRGGRIDDSLEVIERTQMAPLARLELTTHCLEGNCSVQMSYRGLRKREIVYHKPPSKW